MGYNARPELVEEWKDQLEAARIAVETGQEMTLKTQDPGRDQYRFRRALKASELYPTECGGRYAGLGKLVRLTTVAGGIVITPRVSGSEHLNHERPTEFDALEKIKHFPSNAPIVEFWPSDQYDERWLREEVQKLGFKDVGITEGLEGNGSLRVGALRVTGEKKANILDGYGVSDKLQQLKDKRNQSSSHDSLFQ